MRRPSVVRFTLVAFTLLALGFRLAESPANPLGLVRVAVCLAAVAFVWCGPLRGIASRATIVLALDIAVGVFGFATVDAPFVFAHQAEIGQAAGAFAERLAALEWNARSR